MAINTKQISVGLVAALNGGSYSKQFIAVCKVLPLFEIKDLATLQVTVIPRSVDASVLTRDSLLYEHAVDVAVQKKLDKPFEGEFDSLVAFVFELAEAIRDLAIPSAVFSGITIKPLYLLDDLAQDGIFTSVITVNYKTTS